MPDKLLVIDDDESIRSLVRKYMAANGFAVVLADNGSEGLILVRESRPDVVLVDAEMPGLDGYAVCRMLKKEETTRRVPVILMSGSRVDDHDVVAGLGEGADDYVLKPFSLPVLLARVQAVRRRFAAPALMSGKLKKAGIELDPAGRALKVAGKPVTLTRKEFDLLTELIEKSGRVLSVAYLLQTVWGYDPADYNDPGTVEVHVSHLRKKLGPAAAKRIVSVMGHGYKFEE